MISLGKLHYIVPENVWEFDDKCLVSKSDRFIKHEESNLSHRFIPGDSQALYRLITSWYISI